VTWKAVSEPDKDALDAAMALLLYTGTTEESYRARISRRVLDLLAKDEAFGFMMQDMRDRIAALARNKRRFTYDSSQLKGRLAEVTGIAHCNTDPGVRWVHVSGVMNFGYDSVAGPRTAPTNWPADAGLFVPIIIEDGTWKFDGYCTEPSLAGVPSVAPN
jgi:hypothetical protein